MLIQLTSKENERTLKFRVPLAVATRVPWLQSLRVKLLRLEPAVPRAAPLSCPGVGRSQMQENIPFVPYLPSFVGEGGEIIP